MFASLRVQCVECLAGYTLDGTGECVIDRYYFDTTSIIIFAVPVGNALILLVSTLVYNCFLGQSARTRGNGTDRGNGRQRFAHTGPNASDLLLIPEVTLSVIAFSLDIAFLVSVWPSHPAYAWTGIAIYFFGSATNIAMTAYFMFFCKQGKAVEGSGPSRTPPSKEFGSEERKMRREWIRAHIFVVLLILLFSTITPAAMLVFSSQIFRFDVFAAPWRPAENYIRASLFWPSLLFGLPMLGLQLAYATLYQGGLSSASLLTLLAFGATFVSVGYSVWERTVLALLTLSGGDGYSKAERTPAHRKKPNIKIILCFKVQKT